MTHGEPETRRIREAWAGIKAEQPDLYRKLIEAWEAQFGKDKAVVNVVTGLTHRVPTERIITVGINQSELPSFPLWGPEPPQ